MTAVMNAPAECRCRIDEVFGGNFIDLLALAPRNPLVRVLILAQTRKMPPAECLTFEEIKVWVETNCEKKLHRPVPTASSGEGIDIMVEFTETECGRASYSVPRSGSEEYRLGEEPLLAMVLEAIDSEEHLDAVVENIAEKIRDEAWDQCDPSLDDYGDYQYEEHDSDDTGNSHLEFSKAQIRERLTAFLRQRYPDLLEDLI
jgi:hypothetical protein